MKFNIFNEYTTPDFPTDLASFYNFKVGWIKKCSNCINLSDLGLINTQTLVCDLFRSRDDHR